MKKKTFKIGECCIGGIIHVVITSKVVSIQALDWNTKAVNRRQEFATVWANKYEVESEMEYFLESLTTCYHADKVLKYIKDNVTF